MKKIFFFLSILTGIVTFNACGSGDDDVTKGDTPEEITPSINIADAQDLQFGQENIVDDNAQTISIAFSTNMNWTLTAFNANGGWCTPSISSGSKGNSSITFTISANEDSEDRTSSFTLACGTLSQNIIITQKGRNSLTLSTDRFEVPFEGGEIDIQVLSNVDYTIEIPEEYISWIHRMTTRSAVTITHNYFKVDASEEYEKRDAVLKIKSSLGEEEVHVYQVGGAVLVLSQNKYSVAAEGGDITIIVSSNFDYGVDIPKNGWIHKKTSRGVTVTQLKIGIDANKTYSSRTAEIVVYDKNSDMKEVVTISQTGQHEYVDLGLPSGTKWATCNVGADTPGDFGDYFAWAEVEPKSNYNWIAYKYCFIYKNALTKYCYSSALGYDGYVDDLTELSLSDDAAYVNWGTNWRMPSKDQISELFNIAYTKSIWTSQNGKYGRLITSKSNGASIFIPAAGIRSEESYFARGSSGYFWSRSLGKGYNGCGSAYCGLVEDGNSYNGITDMQSRVVGIPVRPVRR